MFDHDDTDDARWAAVSTRDPSADGDFFSCVTTTGVYCLASCAGRPQRRHVVFAATRREAEQAGFGVDGEEMGEDLRGVFVVDAARFGEQRFDFAQ